MSLRESGYRDRLVDPLLAHSLEIFGAAVVEGPKWCGKTWTCLNHCESAFYVGDPFGGFANKTLATLDPAGVLDGESPRLIDEWQEVPALWDAVRFAADRTKDRGLFLLTGSTKPRHDATLHSGAGRISRITMWPMSLLESGDSDGTASLSKLFAGEKLTPQAGNLSLDAVNSLILRGGWPGSLGFEPADGSRLAADYLRAVAESEISSAGQAKRDPIKVMSVLRSLARHTASTASIATIAKDTALAGRSLTSEVSTRAYLAELDRLFVYREIPAWSPNLRSATRLRTSGKRLLADPSLSAAALGATTASLRSDLNATGFLFEALCLRDLSVYADTMYGQLFHYQDASGLEADAIITLPDGRWVGIEIKLGFNQVDAAAQNLLKLSTRVSAETTGAPAALIVLVGVGGIAHTREDGVHIVPIDHFGP